MRANAEGVRRVAARVVFVLGALVLIATSPAHSPTLTPSGWSEADTVNGELDSEGQGDAKLLSIRVEIADPHTFGATLSVGVVASASRPASDVSFEWLEPVVIKPLGLEPTIPIVTSDASAGLPSDASPALDAALVDAGSADAGVGLGDAGALFADAQVDADLIWLDAGLGTLPSTTYENGFLTLRSAPRALSLSACRWDKGCELRLRMRVAAAAPDAFTLTYAVNVSANGTPGVWPTDAIRVSVEVLDLEP